MKFVKPPNDREWTQIRAALMFWAEVAEVSKVHPSRHSRVEPLFKRHAPLTVAEIEDFLSENT